MIREFIESFIGGKEQRTASKVDKIGDDVLKNIKRLEDSLLQKDYHERFLMQSLFILNEENNGNDKVRKLITCIKEFSKFEAIAIRLRVGADFPYYHQNGFSADFILDENYLCGPSGLECMCGAVLEERTDPNLPFFTAGGSFWTAHASRTAEELPDLISFPTRNRCVQEGYESIALIPLRSGNDIVGLLQLCDHRRDMFEEGTIHFFEMLGAVIGVALRRMLTETRLKHAQSHYEAMLKTLPCLIFRMSKDAVYLEAQGREDFFYIPSEEHIGKKAKDILPKDIAQLLKRKIADCLAGPTGNVITFQYDLPIAGGARRWQARMVQYNGLEEVLIVVSDITKTKKRR